jgi:lipoprotein-anchoring transpeptidase ErfK/SrfK
MADREAREEFGSGTIALMVARVWSLRGVGRLGVVALFLGLAGCGGGSPLASNPHLGTTTTGVASTGHIAAGASLQAPPGSVLVATATVPNVPVYVTPRALGPAQTLANPNPLGASLTFLVNEVQGGWLQVYLPERPNESLGWVSRSNVSVTTDDEHIVVNLTNRTLTLYSAGAQAFQASVAVGAPDAPTPTGHFYVTEVLQLTDPGDAYGPYALGLSGFSNTYYSFDGGPGQIAIHGTNQPWVIGGYASHGCVRLNNAEITKLATQVPAGTPVDIVA